jgi:hypothetical protein
MYERVIVEAPTVEILDSLIDQGKLLSIWARLYLPQHAASSGRPGSPSTNAWPESPWNTSDGSD